MDRMHYAVLVLVTYSAATGTVEGHFMPEITPHSHHFGSPYPIHHHFNNNPNLSRDTVETVSTPMVHNPNSGTDEWVYPLISVASSITTRIVLTLAIGICSQ
jgi:hypothetical protein